MQTYSKDFSIRIKLMRRFLVLVALLMLCTMMVSAQNGKGFPLPKVSIGIEKATKPSDVSMTVQIVLLMTVLSLAPALLIMTTCFIRIIIVFHFLKQAMGTQQMPPAQILVGLAMFITFFIMAPVWNQINDKALQPYMKNQITQEEAYNKAVEPLRQFMFKQTREKDLALFINMANMQKPATRDDIPTYVLIPAFSISEMRIGFQMGFIIFVPFLMIDMICASILMSMGMMMLPPVLVSLPFKILLFILVDGWYLIVNSVLMSFQ